LAHDLDVEPEAMLRWLRFEDQRAILSSDGNELVPKQELEAITAKLRESLSSGIVSKEEYELQTNIAFESLLSIIRDIDNDLVYHDDYVCPKAYEELLSEKALEVLNRAIDKTT
jgi:pSer/pThr/pTyr-binding forkhead associated (FHA) protein